MSSRFRTLQILLMVCGCLPLGAAEWRTTVPFTYNIEYGKGHVGNPQYLRTIAEAPPTLLHVGEDIPFSSTFGTKSEYAGVEVKLSKVLTAEEIRVKIAELKQYTGDLHRAGVRQVIPYICNELAFGDHLARTGVFAFFDQWERYAEFGFGPKPPEDFLLARKFYPFQSLRRAKPEEPYYPMKVYSMCTNNPYWRQYLLAVTANAARCGYDGIFTDVMTIRDYCPHCQRKFREYLGARYTAARRMRRFGTADLGLLALAASGDGALWFDTQAFWSESNTEFLRAVKAEGQRENPAFFVVPNLGPLAHFDGVQKRATQGMSPAAWAQATDLFLVEEMQRPGRLRGEYFIDNILQYKMAFALGFRAGMLLYNAQEATGIELAMAEAGAGGGGALIQGGYKAPASRRKFRRFFEEHRDLYEGYESCADVAVLFDYDQLYWGNRSHLQSIYRLVDYLPRRHILFDLITPEQARTGRLGRYKAVITPYVRYLPDTLLAQLKGFQARGGVWIDIGDSGRFDQDGRVRPGPARPSELEEYIPYPRFALYLLKEDDANEIAEVLAMLDASLAGENPPPARRVKKDLQAALEAAVGWPLSVIGGQGLDGLRVNVWRKGDSLTAHLVNYYCDIAAKTGEERAPKTLENVVVRLHLPEGRVASARLVDPDTADPAPVAVSRKGAWVELTVPSIRIYKIAKLGLARPGS